VSTLLEAELDGEKLSEARLLAYCTLIMGTGTDTTRALLTGMAIALAEHPDQLSRLRDDRTLMASAVDEALRWVTPARGFVRTATADTEIRGQTIKAGQRLYLEPGLLDLTDPKARIETMDALGVDVQLVFSTFYIGAEIDNPLEEAALARSYNRWVAERLAGHTDRLRWVPRRGRRWTSDHRPVLAAGPVPGGIRNARIGLNREVTGWDASKGRASSRVSVPSWSAPASVSAGRLRVGSPHRGPGWRWSIWMRNGPRTSPLNCRRLRSARTSRIPRMRAPSSRARPRNWDRWTSWSTSSAEEGVPSRSRR
jgi:hypothetical protein